jgi:hypothetical protein
VSVPPILWEGSERRGQICFRRFILPPDMREDPAYVLYIYN